MERRYTNLPLNAPAIIVRTEGDKSTQTFEGYGAIFYDGTPATEYTLWDCDSEIVIERILPGAFDKALSRPDDVRGLFNHDPSQILGRTAAGTMKLSIDKVGLLYQITPDDTDIAVRVAKHLKRKDVSGSSIMFVVDEESWTQTRDATEKWTTIRSVVSVSLMDTGPVTFPAYSATTAGVRSSRDVRDARRSLLQHKKTSTPALIATPNLNEARLRLAENA